MLAYLVEMKSFLGLEANTPIKKSKGIRRGLKRSVLN
jgi:hypothetical protein